MRISDFVQKLQAMQAEHGDLEVETDNVFGRVSHGGPEVAYRKVLAKRERKACFWSGGSWEKGQQGDKVCRI